MSTPPTPLVTVAEANAFIDANLPFCAPFGIRLDALDIDTSLVRWRYDAKWTRPGGESAFVCGPVMMTLADVGIYTALFGRFGILPIALTNELKTNFLRPAFDHDLLCRSRIVKAGRRIAYGIADVYEDGSPDRLVAQATSSYVMPD